MKALAGCAGAGPQALVALLVAVGAWSGPGCRGSQAPAEIAPPAQPAPAAASAEAPPAGAQGGDMAQPAAQPEAQPARPAAARAPRTPLLIQREGDPTGPLPYLVLEPASARADLPVVIALHGRGDRAEQFARLAEALHVPLRFVVVRAPLPWGPSAGRQWFDSDSPDGDAQIAARTDELAGLADRLHEAWPDAPKPLLLGFSQGAMLTLQAVARHPERFGAAVALSGMLPLAKGNAKAKAPVPTLVTVGAHDPVVTPERTRAAAEALKALGHAPELFEFDGGHAVPRSVVARVRAFLREHAGLGADDEAAPSAGAPPSTGTPPAGEPPTGTPR